MTTHTPRRTFRIPDDIYNPAQQRAEREDTTVTAVVQECLRRYGETGATSGTPGREGSGLASAPPAAHEMTASLTKFENPFDLRRYGQEEK